MNYIFFLNEELGVRVRKNNSNLDIQIQFKDRWVNVDSYFPVNRTNLMKAEQYFKYECERRKKQNEDNRNHVGEQKVTS